MRPPDVITWPRTGRPIWREREQIELVPSAWNGRNSLDVLRPESDPALTRGLGASNIPEMGRL